jgi:hypothetical protein
MEAGEPGRGSATKFTLPGGHRECRPAGRWRHRRLFVHGAGRPGARGAGAAGSVPARGLTRGILEMDMQASDRAPGAQRRAERPEKCVWMFYLNICSTGSNAFAENIAQKSLVPPTADYMFPPPFVVLAADQAGRWAAKDQKKHRVPSQHCL